MRYHTTMLMLMGLMAAGCTNRTEQSQVVEGPAADGAPGVVADHTPAESPPPDSAAQVSLETKSWQEVQQWVASQKGKVVVVDVWSTYCPTCMEEFPHFVQMHKAYPDRVAAASLSVNYYGGKGTAPEDDRADVLRFLELQSAMMPNFLSSDPDSQVLEEISTVAIPAALVYDQQGNLRQVFNNDTDTYGPEGFSYEADVVPLVEELLAES